jgi:hypothetical protein
MSSIQIYKTIYAAIAIFGTYLTATRLMAGDWVAALWPLAIVAFCVYRLFTMDNGTDQ